jgi:hypothetical protein
MGFLVSPDSDPEDLERYFRGLRRAQREIDLEPDRYKRHWLREIPEDLREAATCGGRESPLHLPIIARTSAILAAVAPTVWERRRRSRWQ